MKSYTDIEQSKSLAEILPLKSADMEYMFLKKDGSKVSNVPFVKDGFEEPECCYIFIPCWSLAALLDVLPRIEDFKPVLDLEINCIQYPSDIDLCAIADNPVDACVAMVEKLNELNLL